MRRSIAILSALAVLALGVAPQDAPAAQIRCDFDPETNVLSVSVGENTPGGLVLRRTGSRIRVSKFFEPPAHCHGKPTIYNTDLIELHASRYHDVEIDLFEGPFAPGATPEPDGSSEIEIRVIGRQATYWLEGGPTAEHFSYMSSSGQNGLNLDVGPGDEDIDLLLPPKTELYVDGRRGSDTIEVIPPVDFAIAASGGRGNDTLLSAATKDRGGAFSGSLLEGGKGRDRIVGSPLSDYIFPGPGIDTVEAEDGSDEIVLGPDKRRDRVDCGPGKDIAGNGADPFDQARRCEYVGRDRPR